MTLGEIIMQTGAFILALYPVFVAILLDILILCALAKLEGGHPGFLTGFLLGSFFSRNNNYNSGSDASNYLALVILAPINAGLAVLLSLYLGMSISMSLLVCFAPLAGGLVLLSLGAFIHHIRLEEKIEDMAEIIAEKTKSLLVYLAERKLPLAIAAVLGTTVIAGTTLLFHFGLPLYAYGLGFAAVGLLMLLSFAYITKYIVDEIIIKSKGLANGQYQELDGQNLAPSAASKPNSSEAFLPPYQPATPSAPPANIPPGPPGGINPNEAPKSALASSRFD